MAKPHPHPVEYFKITQVSEVIEYANKIYHDNREILRSAFIDFVERTNASFDEINLTNEIQEKIQYCTYPKLEVDATSTTLSSNGFRGTEVIMDRDIYVSTVTRPKTFESYLEAELSKIAASYPDLQVCVAEGETKIPLSFAVNFRGVNSQANLNDNQYRLLSRVFPMPDLKFINDHVVDGEFDAWRESNSWDRSMVQTHLPNHYHSSNGNAQEDRERPLALYDAPRTDYSVERLRHYCHTPIEDFQPFVLLTNYAFYVERFIEYANRLVDNSKSGYTKFVAVSKDIKKKEAPNRVFDPNHPNKIGRTYVKPDAAYSYKAQMPAYHLHHKSGQGITLINIGVGPSNARNITDHLAVLRSNCWIMLGHCAGLRQRQRIGDLVLANGYVRQDGSLSEVLPLDLPTQTSKIIRDALMYGVVNVENKYFDPKAEEEVTKNDWEQQFKNYEKFQVVPELVKRKLRTGVVLTTDNRNWELLPHAVTQNVFWRGKVVAVDMESATIATNGLRHRVPSGSLLCVSDRPIHGELKLSGAAQDFYTQTTERHLEIAFKAIERLREDAVLEELRNDRSLRSSLNEPPFR